MGSPTQPKLGRNDPKMLRLKMLISETVLCGRLRTANFMLLGALFFTGSIGCEGEDGCSPTLHCGSCDYPIEVYVIDEATGEAVGRTTGMSGLELVGEKGGCNSYGVCMLESKSDSPDTVYEFEIHYKDEVLGTYSLTPVTNEDPAKCCPCLYTTRVVELVVDWAEVSK